MVAGAVCGAFMGLLVFYGVVTATEAALWQAFLSAAIAAAAPLVQAKFTRDRVMPVETILEAGYTPEGVNARAADPRVLRVWS
jgi:hypothetical protein